jgi:tripartite-type tricarboxylate transporter receptor subunit TctC
MKSELRRRILLGAAAGLALPLEGYSQGISNRPVRIILGQTPGTTPDLLARTIAPRMSAKWSQPFVVENRGGAGGDVGVDAVAKSRPDGTTLGLGGIASHAISPTLKASLPFDPAKDFTFVSGLWQLPNLLIVNNDLPVRSVPELIALLKASPGKYSYGSAGPGTTLHLSGAMLGQLAGLDIQHVPYRGAAPAMIDLIAGRVQFMLDNIPGAIAQAREGKVRALAVTSAKRSPVAPDLPSLAEFLPGFDIVSWTCLIGPAGLPPAMVARMNALTKRALASEDLKRAYFEQGAQAWWTTPEDIASHRVQQYEKLRPLILASGAQQG